MQKTHWLVPFGCASVSLTINEIGSEKREVAEESGKDERSRKCAG